jgi:hypothetical protein
LFVKLAQALRIDEKARSRLAYEDYKIWLSTPANPPTPYLLRPGFRGCIDVPEELNTVEAMEQYASDYARRHGTVVTLVLDNRIYVRFDKDGTLKGITEAQPPENPRGKRSC